MENKEYITLSDRKVIAAWEEIDWENMASVQDARRAAVKFMESWDWQGKVEHFTEELYNKRKVSQIAKFMQRAMKSGQGIKLRINMAKIKN